MTEDRFNHINVGISFADLVRTTLGPRGMNKMVVNEATKEIILTNDGASIIKNVKSANPIADLFKNLAISQENAIGDGTTTSTIIAGQLLQNALVLMNKGIHPTTIINGYNLAKVRAMQFLENNMEEGNIEMIIKTAFGTKISNDIIDHFTELLKNEKDFNLKRYKISESDPMKSEIYPGFVFEGFTANERMNSNVKGKIAVIDFPINIDVGNLSIQNSDEIEKVTKTKREIKKSVIVELVKNKVSCLFYTDTEPEFESMLTNAGITGIVVYNRENVDGICRALNLNVCSSKEELVNNCEEGEVSYVKQTSGNRGHIYVSSERSKLKTLVIRGPTEQTLNEIERAVLDVLGLLKNDTHSVIGAGAIEIEIALDLREFANHIGGKEQLAIEMFAESLESIPMIIAENAGLDAIKVVTNLKAIHKSGEKDIGVDVINEISDARKRGVIEPVLVKIHAINAATNVANLILKLDQILVGESNA